VLAAFSGWLNMMMIGSELPAMYSRQFPA
jgi:hypothetical protein